MILVLDIDGTLADVSHREHFVDKENPTEEDWANFDAPENVEKDVPYPEAQEAFEIIKDVFDDIVFLSGRMAKQRELTEDWLSEHYGVDTDESNLYLRGDDDLRKSTEIKKEAIEALLIEYQDEDFVFVDDKPENVEMMGEFGLALRAPGCWEFFLTTDEEEEQDVNVF